MRISLCIAIATMLVPGVAFAWNLGVSAHRCKPVEGAPSFYSDTKLLYGTSNPVIENEIVCPMYRPNANTSPLENIVVGVLDYSEDELLFCWAKSCTKFSDSCDVTASPESTPLNFDGGYDELELGSLDGFTQGHGFIYCQVPDPDGTARSGVRSYRYSD